VPEDEYNPSEDVQTSNERKAEEVSADKLFERAVESIKIE